VKNTSFFGSFFGVWSVEAIIIIYKRWWFKIKESLNSQNFTVFYLNDNPSSGTLEIPTFCINSATISRLFPEFGSFFEPFLIYAAPFLIAPDYCLLNLLGLNEFEEDTPELVLKPGADKRGWSYYSPLYY